MAASNRLILDRSHLIQMLTDPGFYTAVPAMQSLRDPAMSAKAADNSSGCTACDNTYWPAMKNVCDAFLLQIREAGAVVHQQIKNWLSTRKNYAVTRCVIYYRYGSDRDAIQKYEF